MLKSSEAALLQRQRYTLVGVAAARRSWQLGDPRGLVPALTVLQGLAAQAGADSVGAQLAEQNIDAPEQEVVNPKALAGTASDGRPLGSLLEQAATLQALELMVFTQIADAGRVGAGLSIAARPHVGWVRMVTPPCCARCAVLAGKYFKWNSGFDRHPLCDCSHVPTQENVAGDVRTDPKALFDAGHVTGVTRAEQKAINDGADINRVINARRSRYMDKAGNKLTRESTTRRGTGIAIRHTPEQIYRTAGDDKPAAVQLLKKYGYLL